MSIKETIKKHSKYKYTCYQNTHTLQNSHIHTPTHTTYHKKKLKPPQYKIHRSSDSL